MEPIYENKTNIIDCVQKLYDDSQRLNESNIQFKCEMDLKLRENLSIIKKQEDKIKILMKEKEELEKNNINKDKQIHEYSELIKKFEHKVHELTIEKNEKERFDITRAQANTILAKEKEIERLMDLLNKSKDKNKESKKDKKILNVIDLIENDIPDNDNITVNVIKNTKVEENKVEENKVEENKIEENKVEENKVEENKVEENKIEENKVEENKIEENKVEEDDYEDDDYEIITYRKKEYWIKTGENPQYVYEIINDDELGNRLGVYKLDKKGKMKVFLDK